MFTIIIQLLQSNDLKGKFTRGSAILTTGTVVENIARLGRNIILARFLAPEYFGQMAAVMAAVALFEAITDVGVKQSIIQNKNGNTLDFLNAAWWFSAIRGLGLYGLAFLATPLYCNFFSNPELVLPLRVALLAILLNGLTSPRIYVLEKELKYLKLTLLRQGSALLNVAAAVFLSLFFKNIWPLVIGFLVEYFSICLLSHFFCTLVPRFSLNRLYLKELGYFAKGMIGLPILTAIFLQIDVFAIGRYLSMDQLGLYYLARNLAAFPLMAFSKIVRPILLPAFAKMQDDLQEMSRALIKIETLIGAIISPIIAFFVISPGMILGILYGKQYSEASLPLAILMVTAIVRLYSGVLMQIFFALGRPNSHRTFALIRLIAALIIIYPAIIAFGMSGGPLTIFFCFSFLLGLQLAWTEKKLGLKVLAQLTAISKGLVFAMVVVVPGMAIKSAYPENILVVISAGITLTILSWIIAARSYLVPIVK